MKRRNFTLSIKNDYEKLIPLVEQCPQYAWILHDADTNTDTGELIEPHIHVYIEFPNPRSFKSIADILDIPENMVCKVIDKNGILQYLIHKNQPDKFQYNFSDIHTNFDLEPYFMEKSNTLWYDFNQLKRFHITPDEFYAIHKSEIDANAFYQRLRIFDMISAYDDIPPRNTYPMIHNLLK